MSEENQTGVEQPTPEVKPAEQAPTQTAVAEATPSQEPAKEETANNEQLPPPPAEIPVPAEPAPAPEPAADAPSEGAAPKPASPAKPPRGPKTKGQKQQPKGFTSHDEKMAWIAARHARNQQQLLGAGYPAPVVMSVMRFMQSNPGYESYAKDNLINCLCRLGENLLYRLDSFTLNDSANLMISIVDIYDRLVHEPKLHNVEADEGMRITQSIIDTHVKPKNDKISGILKHALGVKFVDGYAGRAVYLFECLIDISMKMLDPFQGMLHDQKLPVPEALKKFYGPKKAKCRKCGKPLVYDKKFRTLVCDNATCEEYHLPHTKRNKDNDQGQPGGFGHKWHSPSGAPVPQESQTDKFNKRFAKGGKPFQKKRRPEPRPPINRSFAPDGAGEFSNTPFANLTLPTGGAESAPADQGNEPIGSPS